MKKNKKMKWYYTFGLVFASVLTFAIPFLTLASDFNSNYTFAEDIVIYNGDTVDFMNCYTGTSPVQYRDCALRLYNFRVYNNLSTFTFNFNVFLSTRFSGSNWYQYYSSNSSSSNTQYLNESANGISYTFSSTAFSVNQTLLNATLYCRQFAVGSSSASWQSSYNQKILITYTAGSVSNFGSVVGIRYGVLATSSMSVNLSSWLSDYRLYIDSTLIGSTSSLFFYQLFDNNNNAINVIFETNFQGGFTQSDMNSNFQNSSNGYSVMSLPDVRTYYIVNENSSQYLVGYNEGYTDGYNDGDLAGYSEGYENGYSAGNSAGYNEGVLDANQYSFLGLIGAVVDAPIQAFNGLLNFEILGFNMRDFYLGLFSVCIIVLIVRLVLNK